MKSRKGVIVPLGYGKYARADRIVLVEPIQDDRGPGRRTRVYIEGVDHAVIASRSDSALIRDMTGSSGETERSLRQEHLLSIILDTITQLDPTLQSIIQKQGNWDLRALRAQIQDVLEEDQGPQS